MEIKGKIETLLMIWHQGIARTRHYVYSTG